MRLSKYSGYGLVVLIFMTLCGGFWLVFGGTVDYFINGGCPSSEPDKIQGVAQIQLPPSTHNLKSSCFGLQGWAAEAYFEIEATELDIFLTSTSVKELSSEGKPSDIGFADDELTQKARRVKVYLYGEYESPEWHETILIDMSDSEEYKVFFLVLAG